MRELERDLPATTEPAAPDQVATFAIVGDGRAGGAIARAARAGGAHVEVLDRAGRPEGDAGTVLLCVPDREVAGACERAREWTPRFIGHVSGSLGLDALAARGPGTEAFTLHPLQTIPAADTELAGAPCAVSGTNTEALTVARGLALTCGMRPFELPEAARAAYHAAASIASNFLVALEESAAGLLEAAGVADAREALSPLVLRTAANWSEHGAAALTGPIARGDEETVDRHLAALRELAPGLIPLYEALADRTRAIAASREGESS